MHHVLSPRYRTLVAAVLLVSGSACAGRIDPIDVATVTPPAITLPLTEGSARFAVIGDTGTGGSAQYRTAARLAAAHTRFPFEWVIMAGDNMYGSDGAADYAAKFEIPYKPLLDAGVKFYAALGNHDDPNQIFYEPFNMGGKRFYAFKPKPDLRFFALDSNYMSPEQLRWLEKELSASESEWKIAFFHHPLYSEGRHGSDLRLRQVLEPLFTKYGVDVVVAGHEHFYERVEPQKDIYHFTVGGSAKLRPGDIDRKSAIHAAGFDKGHSFMLVEVVDDEMHFQAISDQGKTVDSGVIRRGTSTR